jgi:hypothetical protein
MNSRVTAGSEAPPARAGEPILYRSALALSLAAGIAGYTAAVAALISLGVAESLRDPVIGWPARDALYALLACGLALAGVLARTARPSASRARVGTVLVGLGSAWLLLGLIDQHVFDLFEIDDGRLTSDLLFHGVGTAVACGGFWLLPYSEAA